MVGEDPAEVAGSSTSKDVEQPSIATVVVLENHGEERNLPSFASDISASTAVQGGMGVFAFNSDGTLRFNESRKDPILGAPGLDHAISFGMSPDRRHVYTADFGSDTVSILDHSQGDARMKLLDRRGHGEERVRFLVNASVATQDPCAALPIEAGDRVYIGVAQGCEDFDATRLHLPSVMRGDAIRAEPIDDPLGSLWNNTVFYFKMQAALTHGTYSRPRRTRIPCVEVYDMFTSPASVKDARGRFPDGTMGGIDDGAAWYNCREKTLADAPAVDQVSILTFMMNNGMEEALQLDGSMNKGLWVVNDLDSVLHMLPTHRFSIECWFMMSEVNEDSTGGGIFSMASGDKGLLLEYEFRQDTVAIVFSMFSTAGKKRVQKTYSNYRTALTIWHHFFVTYDGVDLILYWNGELTASENICPEDEPDCAWVDYPRCLNQVTGERCQKTASMLLGGVEQRDAFMYKRLIGAIHSFRMYDVVLSEEERLASYERYAARLTPVTEVYWQKVVTEGKLISSPEDSQRNSVLHALVPAEASIKIMGKFSTLKRYRCRWTSGEVDGMFSLDAILQNTESLDGRPTCAGDLNNVATGCSSTHSNQLVCELPLWPYGYKATYMSVVEYEGSNELQAGAQLWQRVCITRDCGYGELEGILGRKIININSASRRERPRWWLHGTQAALFELPVKAYGEAALCCPHHFGQNRGDKTLFVFRTQSSLREFSDGALTTTAPSEISHALGAASLRQFRALSGERFVAIANFWDGYSTSVVSSIARFDEQTGRVDDIVTMVTTEGASAWEYFRVRNGSLPEQEFVAVANFAGPSQILRWDLGAARIQSVSIVKSGTNYLPGILRITGSVGEGFAAKIEVSDIASGGKLMCSSDFYCVNISDHGRGYMGTPAKGLTDAGLTDQDPDCTLPCDPLRLDHNCTRSLSARCFGRPLGAGKVEVFYTKGCSLDDSDCERFPQTHSISSFTLAPRTELPGTNKQKGATTGGRIGHTNKCFSAGYMFHDGSIAKLSNFSSFRLDYSIGSSGQIESAALRTASAHGFGYKYPLGIYTGNTPFPGLSLTDAACRCGTTVTQIRKIDNGTGYTCGTLTLSGPGSGFDAVYNVLGNVSEARTVTTGLGYTSMPRVLVVPNLLIAKDGSDGRGVEAIGVLAVKHILLLSGGARYSVPPVVRVESPTLVDGETARARAVLSTRPDELGLFSVEEVVLEHEGYGYTHAPLVSFVNGDEEDPQRVGGSNLTGVVQPQAIAILELVDILTNHEFPLNIIPIDLRRARSRLLLKGNWDHFFYGPQNELYSQELTGNRLGLQGVDLEIIQPHTNTLNADSTMVDKMPLFCEGPFCEIGGAEFLADNHTFSIWGLGDEYLNTTNATELNETRFDELCTTLCLTMPDCKAVEIGMNSAIGECWVHLTQSPDGADGLWSFDGIRAAGMDLSVNFSKGCVTNTTWLDSNGWSCANYSQYLYCGNGRLTPGNLTVPELWVLREVVVTDDGGGNGTNATVNASNVTFYENVSFFDLHAVEGLNAIDSCCMCGKPGPGYKVFVRQHGEVQVDPINAVELMCRPKSSLGLVPDTAHCNFPFTNVTVPNPNQYLRIYDFPPHPGDFNFSNPVPEEFEPFILTELVPNGTRTVVVNTTTNETSNETIYREDKSFDDEAWYAHLRATLPYNISIIETSERRCCLDPASGLAFVTITEGEGKEETHTTYPLTGVTYNVSYSTDDFSRNDTMIADGLGIPLAAIGRAGSVIRAHISRLEESRPVKPTVEAIVTGKIHTITQIRRGTNYTNDYDVEINPLENVEYHNKSKTDLERWFFREAVIEVDVGFSGAVSGTFDGSNLDAMCSSAEAGRGLCSRSLPYGQGFGPCAAVQRASGAEFLATTQAVDVANSTYLDTTGASGIVSFKSDNETYLVVANYMDPKLFPHDRFSNVRGSDSALPFSSTALRRGSDEVAAATVEMLSTPSVVYRVRVDEEGVPSSEEMQLLDTRAAVAITVFESGGVPYVVIAEERGPVSKVFRWSSSDARFELLQNVPTFAPKSLHVFSMPSLNEADQFFMLVSQDGAAEKCLLDDPISPQPSCGDAATRKAAPYGTLVGARSYGPALTEQYEQGRSTMMRWNGTAFQSVNTPTTLSADLSGGQVFVSNRARDFVKFAHGGEDYTLLLNSEDEAMCKNDPQFKSSESVQDPVTGDFVTKKYTCENVTRESCQRLGALACDKCPRACGICEECNDQLRGFEEDLCEDRPQLLDYSFPVDTCAEYATGVGGRRQLQQFFQRVSCEEDSNFCFACPQHCGICSKCKQHYLRVAGDKIGYSFNTNSTVLRARKESRQEHLKGPSSALVSPEGTHVYIASYFSRGIAGFSRNNVTGLLVFDRSFSLSFITPGAGFSSTESLPLDSEWCEHDGDCSATGFGRPLHGLAQAVIDAEGLHIYAVSAFENALHVISRDRATGGLRLSRTVENGALDGARIVDGIAGARALWLSHNGRSVYVAGSRDQAVAIFSRGSDGKVAFVDRLKNGERLLARYAAAPPAHPEPRYTSNGTQAHLGADGAQLGASPARVMTGSVRAARAFAMDGVQFLALGVGDDAVEGADPSPVGFVVVWRWDAAIDGFSQVQRLTTEVGVVDLEHFFLVDGFGSGFHYLAAANSHAPADTSGVNVYRWIPSRGEFVLHHALPLTHPDGVPMLPESASGAVIRGIKYFKAGPSAADGRFLGLHFLAVAFYAAVMDGIQDPEVASYVFAWNNDGVRMMGDGTRVSGFGFEAFQRMQTRGATDFDHLVVPCDPDVFAAAPSAKTCVGGEQHFLAAAHMAFGSAGPSSTVWRYWPASRNIDPFNEGLWNQKGRPGYLEKLAELPVSGAAHVFAFSAPGAGYFFAFAERQSQLTPGRTQVSKYKGGVSIFRFDVQNAAQCIDACFSLHQHIDGIETDTTTDIPGKTVFPGDAVAGQTHGVTAIKAFWSGGELYLAVAQSLCPLGTTLEVCGTDLVAHDEHPPSMVLQWNRRLQRFTEMLALTDASEESLRGRPLTDAELENHADFHSYALRLRAGRAVGLEALEVPSSRGVHNTSLLVVASVSEGALVYTWDFEKVTGLNGTAAVAALLPGAAYASPGEGQLIADRSVFLGEIVLAETVPEVSAAPESAEGESVYAVGALDRALVHLRREVQRDSVGRTVAQMVPVALWQQGPTPSPRGAPAGPEGLASPAYLRVYMAPMIAPGFNATEAAPVVYAPGLAVVAANPRSEPTCRLLSNGPCQQLVPLVSFVSGNPDLLDGVPSIDVNGALSFRPRRNRVGVATYEVRAADSAGGVAAEPQLFQLALVPVNTKPRFDVVGTLIGTMNSGPAQLVFAVNVTPGAVTRFAELPVYEEAQHLSFDGTFAALDGSGPVFAREPRLDVSAVDGALVAHVTFQPAQHWYGSVEFRIVLEDDGPVNPVTGSTNRSDIGHFRINVTYHNSPPYFAFREDDPEFATVLATACEDTDACKDNQRRWQVMASPEVPGGLSFRGRVLATRWVCSQDLAIHDPSNRFCVVPTQPEQPICRGAELTCEGLSGRQLPKCRMQAPCPAQEQTQNVTFHVVAARRITGTFVGSDRDILNTGGGVFAPPHFSFNCSVAPLLRAAQAEEIRLVAELAALDGNDPSLEARLEGVRGLIAAPPTGHAGAFTPEVDMHGVGALQRERARLMAQSCDGCAQSVRRCIGACRTDSCDGHLCTEGAGGSCDGLCVSASCEGNLTIGTPNFGDSLPEQLDPFEDASVATFDASFLKGIILPEAYGDIELTIAMMDDGGGTDMYTDTFVLSVHSVNTPPRMTSTTEFRLLRASEPITHNISSLLNVDMGVDILTQSYSFSVMGVIDPEGVLFEGPHIDHDGTVSFTQAPFASGLARLSINVADDGGTEFEGANNKTSHIDVLVLPVNVAPSAKLPSMIALVEDAGPITRHLFATHLSKGLPDEYWQNIDFAFEQRGDSWSNDFVRLFQTDQCELEPQCAEGPRGECLSMRWKTEGNETALPTLGALQVAPAQQPCGGSPPRIDTDGALHLTSARNQHGLASLVVHVADDGGVAYGGQDTMPGSPFDMTMSVFPQPRVLAVSPRFGPLTGNTTVTIRGEFFGSVYARGYAAPSYPLASVAIGGVECLRHEFVSDTEVLCVPDRGIGSGAVTVTVDDPGLPENLWLSPPLRAGALRAADAYSQLLLVFGGSVKPRSPADSMPGLLAVGPSPLLPGTLEAPAASLRRAKVVLPRAVSALAIHRGFVFAGGSFVQAYAAPRTAAEEEARAGGTGQARNRVLRYDGDTVDSLGSGTNGDVLALAEFPRLGVLVVGGMFTEVYQRAGRAVRSGGLALWDEGAGAWSALPGLGEEGMTGFVLSVAAMGPMLVVGGKFDRFSPSTAQFSGIAAYDAAAQEWSPLGAGLTGGETNAILPMCRSGEKPSPALGCGDGGYDLYVGGGFSTAGGAPAANIARWDGVQWRYMGGFDGPVFSLAAFGAWVYAGGSFKTVTSLAGSVIAENVARYHDGRWLPVGDGVGGPVYALAAVRLDNCVYIVGQFDRVCNPGGAPKASSCAEETSPLNHKRANSAARLCAAPGEDLVAAGKGGEWEPLENHEVGPNAKIRAIAQFVE